MQRRRWFGRFYAYSTWTHARPDVETSRNNTTASNRTPLIRTQHDTNCTPYLNPPPPPRLQIALLPQNSSRHAAEALLALDDGAALAACQRMVAGREAAPRCDPSTAVSQVFQNPGAQTASSFHSAHRLLADSFACPSSAFACPVVSACSTGVFAATALAKLDRRSTCRRQFCLPSLVAIYA